MAEIKNMCIKTKEDESSRWLIKLEHDHQHYSLYSLKISPLQGKKTRKQPPTIRVHDWRLFPRPSANFSVHRHKRLRSDSHQSGKTPDTPIILFFFCFRFPPPQNLWHLSAKKWLYIKNKTNHEDTSIQSKTLKWHVWAFLADLFESRCNLEDLSRNAVEIAWCGKWCFERK